jgi:hypothetical protein
MLNIVMQPLKEKDREGKGEARVIKFEILNSKQILISPNPNFQTDY